MMGNFWVSWESHGNGSYEPELVGIEMGMG